MTDFFRACMPYCILRNDDGSYVILNRMHKPIGFNHEGWINYSDYPVNVFFRKLDKRTAKKLSVDAVFDENCIYLYDSSCYPPSGADHMNAYLAKLKILMQWKIIPPERRPLKSHLQNQAGNKNAQLQIS